MFKMKIFIQKKGQINTFYNFKNRGRESWESFVLPRLTAQECFFSVSRSMRKGREVWRMLLGHSGFPVQYWNASSVEETEEGKSQVTKRVH